MKTDLFHIGKFVIHGYGLMIGIGFVLALLVGEYRAKKMGMKEEALIDIAIIAGVSGFLGAKLLYIIVSFKDFIEDPIGVLGSSGFVVYGGLIAGVLCNLIYVKIKKLSFLEYFDLVMPEIALAQGFGRIGCFLAGCCYGKESEHGLYFPALNARVIPTQLIEACFLFALFGVLLWMTLKNKPVGVNLIVYCLAYSVFRFIIEFYRDDPRGAFLGALSPSQAQSIILFFAGAALVVLRIKKPALYLPPAINTKTSSDGRTSDT